MFARAPCTRNGRHARDRDVLSPDSANLRWDNDSVDSTPE